jgi:hypothetical protein
LTITPQLLTHEQCLTKAKHMLAGNNTNDTVVVTNSKSRFRKVKPDKAINYAYFYTNKTYTTHLGVDVDYATWEEVYGSLRRLGIPLPTFFVKTDKGVHLHWELSEKFFLSDTVKDRYKGVQTKIVHAILADPRAVGIRRTWRNPCKFNTYLVSDTQYDFMELEMEVNKLPEALIEKEYIKHTSASTRAGKSISLPMLYATKPEDFKYIHKGDRNTSMFWFLLSVSKQNYYAMPDFKIHELVEKMANEANRHLVNKIGSRELSKIVGSVNRWMATSFNGYTKREKLFKLNAERRLEMIKKISVKYDSSKSDEWYLSLSVRKFAEYFEVSTRTVQKYGKLDLIRLAKDIAEKERKWHRSHKKKQSR